MMTPHPVTIETGEITLPGDIAVQPDSRGLVVFAHGSGSSRHSPRNQHVARVLVRHGFATLLMDLLTEAEEAEDRLSAAYRFDVESLASRLAGATRWACSHGETKGMDIGYFGASTGAAAAIVAASRLPDSVQAIVSRGGRPDLAGAAALESVRAPTLLIVGGADTEVLDLNRKAAACLRAPHEISIVMGATHLFGEPGTLDQVAALAGEWFRKHLGKPRSYPSSASRE